MADQPTTTSPNPAIPEGITSEPGKQGDGTPVGTVAPGVQTNEQAPTPQGGAPADWRVSLPEDLRGEKTFESIKDVGALAKSYLEIRKMQGNALHLPGEKSTPEEVDAFYEKLGVVKDVEKLGVKGPLLPAGMEMKDEEITNFAKTAVGLRMTPAQIQGVMDYYGNFVKGVIPDYKGDEAAATKTLGDEWGLAMDRNMGVARRALFTEFPKETVEKITRMGLANDVGFIKGMFERGKGLIEDGVIPEEIGQGMDNNSAQAKIREMEGDPKSPLWNKDDPKHADFVEKRNQLYKVVFSGQKE